MPLELKQYKDIDRWDRFVAGSPQNTVFCKSSFLEALGEEYELWVVEDGGDPTLGMVVLTKGAEPIRQPYPFTLYQGLLTSENLGKLPPHSQGPQLLRSLDFLFGEYAARAPQISLCLHPRFDDLRGLQWFHYHTPDQGRFQIEVQYTGLIDLRATPGIEGFLASVRPTRRYEYRKALRERLSVEVSQDIETLDRLHRLTFERQGLERRDEEGQLLRAITGAALQHGFGDLLLCRTESGSPASATLFLYDERCGYYLFGSNDPAHRASFSGTFLFLENVRRCQERGLQWVDVCGMNSPRRGDFKASFNTVPVAYHVATWEVPREWQSTC